MQIDRERLRRIIEQFPEVAAVYLFGSAARGALAEESDVDYGLVLKDPSSPRPGWKWRGDLAGRLEDLAPGRVVDLVLLDDQGPLVRHEVLLGGNLLIEIDRDRRIDFESRTYTEAFDFRPTWEIATRGRIERVLDSMERR